MRYELDPKTGEVLRSEQLRNTVMSLVPPIAVERQIDVEVHYPLPLANPLAFVSIEYWPLEDVDRLQLTAVETEPVLVSGGLLYHNEYRGTAKKCCIDPDNGNIQAYREAIGKLDTWATRFLEEDYTSHEQRQDRLVQSIFERPQSDEEAKFSEIEYKLRLFTKDKLDILFGYFVELGVVEQ